MLRVTAGPTYDTSKHQDVLVNSEKPVNISSEHLDARIHVRIKDYRGAMTPPSRICPIPKTPSLTISTGLPKNSPKTSPYFSTPQHPHDRYSISFSFTPKKTLNGDHVVFGNDFEHPIRDRLPPLFDKAFGIVKWWIDPGLDGDVYGDKPYLYGALLSSINVLNVGGKGDTKAALDPNEDKEGEAVVYEEGAEGDGQEVRTKHNIPTASAQRQKHFLNEAKRKEYDFEAGREHKCDFFNPYLDFNEFALKIGYGLPPISILGHWDGQPLRYVDILFLLFPPLFPSFGRGLRNRVNA